MTKPSIKPGLRCTAIILLCITAVMFFLMFSGCKTIHTHSDTHEKETIHIVEKDTVFKYQGGTVTNKDELDSILKYLTSQDALKQRLNGIQNKVIYTDAQNKVALTFWLDKYGKLQAQCTSKDSSWTAKLKDIESRYEKSTSEQKVITVKERYVPVRFWLLLGSLLPFAAIGLIRSAKQIFKLI